MLELTPRKATTITITANGETRTATIPADCTCSDVRPSIIASGKNPGAETARFEGISHLYESCPHKFTASTPVEKSDQTDPLPLREVIEAGLPTAIEREEIVASMGLDPKDCEVHLDIERRRMRVIRKASARDITYTITTEPKREE